MTVNIDQIYIGCDARDPFNKYWDCEQDCNLRIKGNFTNDGFWFDKGKGVSSNKLCNNLNHHFYHTITPFWNTHAGWTAFVEKGVVKTYCPKHASTILIDKESKIREDNFHFNTYQWGDFQYYYSEGGWRAFECDPKDGLSTTESITDGMPDRRKENCLIHISWAQKELDDLRRDVWRYENGDLLTREGCKDLLRLKEIEREMNKETIVLKSKGARI